MIATALTGLAVSIGACLLVGLLAHGLGLTGRARLTDVAAARQQFEREDSFLHPEEVLLAKDGASALAWSAAQGASVLFAHGARWALRGPFPSPPAITVLGDGRLQIGLPDAATPKITIHPPQDEGELWLALLNSQPGRTAANAA